MDRGGWRAIVHEVAESWTQLRTRAHTHAHTHTHTRARAHTHTDTNTVFFFDWGLSSYLETTAAPTAALFLQFCNQPQIWIGSFFGHRPTHMVIPPYTAHPPDLAEKEKCSESPLETTMHQYFRLHSKIQQTSCPSCRLPSSSERSLSQHWGQVTNQPQKAAPWGWTLLPSMSMAGANWFLFEEETPLKWLEAALPTTKLSYWTATWKPLLIYCLKI